MVRGAKVLKLVLDDHGSYLGMEKGCFIVKDLFIFRKPDISLNVKDISKFNGSMKWWKFPQITRREKEVWLL